MGRTLILLVLPLACAPSPRAQLVVSVETDLALPGQVAADDTLSGAASIDRVRVDVFDPSGAVSSSRDFVLLDTPDLPLSFGVVPALDGRARLRVTGFQSGWTQPGAPPIPSVGVAVDRLFTQTVTSLQAANIVLRGECIGRVSDLGADTTCQDATRSSVTAEGAADDPPTDPWPPARAVSCPGAAPAGAVCIPGGASAVGDPALATVDATSDLVPAPPRLVVLKPFFLDENEMTVARFRALASATTALPTLASADSRCNYSPTPSPADNQAVRCVSYATARAACRALGGDLPTAAQWEHAARGRGRGTRYPWGDSAPTCCAAALAGGALGCAPTLDVGTHADPSSCAGLADVSRDGVLDLAGGVREWVLDAAVGLDDCASPGVLADPICIDPTQPPGSTKGGSFATPLESAIAALRRRATSNFDVGFRCVH